MEYAVLRTPNCQKAGLGNFHPLPHLVQICFHWDALNLAGSTPRLRGLMLEMLGGGKCAVCLRTKRLQIHHISYLAPEDEVKHGNYPSHRQYEYYTRLYPLVRDNPDRFAVLCAPCHQIIGLFQARSKDVRKHLWDMILVMSRERPGRPTFSDIVWEWNLSKKTERSPNA